MKEEIKVTNSEWYVMNCLWEKSHLSLMQLVPLLKESAGWSKSTSATMVRRMTEGFDRLRGEWQDQIFLPEGKKAGCCCSGDERFSAANLRWQRRDDDECACPTE